jgi:hypothetical protein
VTGKTVRKPFGRTGPLSFVTGHRSGGAAPVTGRPVGRHGGAAGIGWTEGVPCRHHSPEEPAWSRV